MPHRAADCPIVSVLALEGAIFPLGLKVAATRWGTGPPQVLTVRDGAQGALGRSQRGGSVQGHYLICAPSGAHSVSLRFTPRAPLGNILKPWEEWYRGNRS